MASVAKRSYRRLDCQRLVEWQAVPTSRYGLSNPKLCMHIFRYSPLRSFSAPHGRPFSTGPAPQRPAETDRSAAPSELFRDQNNTWVDRHAPSWMQPYLKLTRIDRPIGTWLVLLPGWWGLSAAAAPGSLPDMMQLALFAIGAFTIRSAGCTVNDMWDRDFDGKVARTAQRPLASGKLSQFNALCFLGAQLAVGLGVLVNLNWPTIQLGIAAVPLVVVYPLMKRVTHYPQVVLGLAMNYGVLMGWAAIHGFDGLSNVMPLYVGAAGWTVVYDTLYAHQDKADDAKLGLKSTALLMGEHTSTVLSTVSLASVTAFAISGYMLDMAWPYYVGVAGSAAHMLWQVRTADYNDRESLTRRFVRNKWVGWIMLAGIVGGQLL